MLRPPMSRANSAPVITFAVPSLRVPVPVRGTLQRTRTDSAGLISPTPLLPRPPRCLTPYPDTSNLPNSLEPSPLSSPAFSAYSVNGSTNGGTDEDVDVDEFEEGVKVNLNNANDKEVMSPGARARADHARLLAPALHMSHLNSPTKVQFKLPLSPMPMRKLKLEAEEGMTSPVYRGPSPIPFPLDLEDDKTRGDRKDKKSENPVFSFSCDSPPSTAEAVGVWLDDQQKFSCKAMDETEFVEVKGAEGVVVELPPSQVLEVHVETFE